MERIYRTQPVTNQYLDHIEKQKAFRRHIKELDKLKPFTRSPYQPSLRQEWFGKKSSQRRKAEIKAVNSNLRPLLRPKVVNHSSPSRTDAYGWLKRLNEDNRDNNSSFEFATNVDTSRNKRIIKSDGMTVVDSQEERLPDLDSDSMNTTKQTNVTPLSLKDPFEGMANDLVNSQN